MYIMMLLDGLFKKELELERYNDITRYYETSLSGSF
jgi:hypothetical protein